MKQRRQLGLTLAVLSFLLIAACIVGFYYVNQEIPTAKQNTAPENPSTAVPTAEPTEAPNRAPELTLLGNDPLYITAQPTAFVDPGCTASDDRDGDITDRISCIVNVDTFHTGEGSVTYTVQDNDGLTASVVRTVIVTEAEPIETVVPEGKTIYLTFDDGPSANTERLLDTLDAYGAKATFFVTACHPDYQDWIGEAARRGHSIGIHSATHDYLTIYQSEEAYFADLNQMQEIIREQTGQETRLVRFPGGSSNTVSSYDPGIVTQLAEDFRAMGYVYFDWNVTAADTAPDASRYTVIENIRDGVRQHDASIVLQHDTNSFSVDAVEAILQWGIENGYTFRALDVTSPTAHHEIAN